MKLKIFNWPKISQRKKIIYSLQKEFALFNVSTVNIVFVTEKEIQKLNKQYRNMDSITDVLSFNFDMKEFLGEIYICSEYVKKTASDYKEEIIRLIIHGILHLLGFNHRNSLDNKSEKTEQMFVKQEKILENILKELK